LLSASLFLRSASACFRSSAARFFSSAACFFSCRCRGDGGLVLLLARLLFSRGRRRFLLGRLLGRDGRVGLSQIADGRRVDVFRLGERRLHGLGGHRRRDLDRGADVQRLGEVAHARVRVLVLVDLEHAEQDVDLRHDPVRPEAGLLRERDRLLQLALRLFEVSVTVGTGGALAERLQLLHRFLGIGRDRGPRDGDRQQRNDDDRGDTGDCSHGC
jgi:hypothetical protein